MSSTRQANHHCVHHADHSAGQPPNRVSERHRIDRCVLPNGQSSGIDFMITMDPIYARSFFDALVTDNSRRSVDTSNHRLRNSVKHAVPLELRRPRSLIGRQLAGWRRQHRADQPRPSAALHPRHAPQHREDQRKAFTSQYRDRDPGRAYASRWRQWLSWD